MSPREFSRRPVFTSTDSNGFHHQIFVMYHATKSHNVASILKNGLKPSTGGLLGPGIYVSRDINKTRAYGGVCFKLLVYTGKTVTVDAADNQGSWRSSFDSAYLPPNNRVVKSRREETCVKSSDQVKILGIAYGYHESGVRSGVIRNLEGTNDDLDREEKMVLENMVLEKKIKSRADELKKEAMENMVLEKKIKSKADELKKEAMEIMVLEKKIKSRADELKKEAADMMIMVLADMMILVLAVVSFVVLGWGVIILLKTVLTNAMALVSFLGSGVIIILKSVGNFFLTNTMALAMTLVVFIHQTSPHRQRQSQF